MAQNVVHQAAPTSGAGLTPQQKQGWSSSHVAEVEAIENLVGVKDIVEQEVRKIVQEEATAISLNPDTSGVSPLDVEQQQEAIEAAVVQEVEEEVKSRHRHIFVWHIPC